MSQEITLTTTFPSDITLRNAFSLSIREDKPVLFDYWEDSLTNACCIGVRDSTKEKMLVKSSEAYTSCISRFLKSGNEYVIMTENSIYIVSDKIKPRKIS